MAEPVLTSNGNDDIDQAIVVNGEIDIRKTHPNLYWMVMIVAVVCVLLAANFFWLKPAFEVFHLSNYVWATAFLALGVAKILFLNVYINLHAVRMTMGFSVGYIFFFAVGTCEPWIDGEGSLQLPIIYLGMAAVQFVMLIEPFLNLWTAKREQ